MDEETRVFRDYLLFTVPHITVFVGALFGLMVLLGLDVKLSTGIFAFVYGMMLSVLGLVIRPHVSRLRLYWGFMAFSLFLLGAGILLIFEALA